MKRNAQEAGFTLVEIALALLVAGLGVMAIFSLFPQALEASRKSVDATETAAFADFVFDGLQIQASDTNSAWSQFKNGSANVLYSNALYLPTQSLASAQGPGTARVFVWIPSYYGSSGGGYGSVGNTALYVTETSMVARFTYTLDINTAVGVAKYARLEVWAGDVLGPVNQAVTLGKIFPGSTVFYREYMPVQ